jgi:hypothetical protein
VQRDAVGALGIAQLLLQRMQAMVELPQRVCHGFGDQALVQPAA